MSGIDGSTNWNAYDVRALWAMVADENTCENWNAPVGWSSMASTIDAHRKNLLKARDALEAAWPPEHNEGARIFVTQIDDLIVSMEESARRAGDIAKATEAVMTQLADAKTALQPLHDKYQEKSNDLVLAAWDDAESEINKQARSIMANAETVIRQHATTIVPPERYTLPELGDGPTMRDPHGSGSEQPGSGGRSDGGGQTGRNGSGIPPREQFTAPHTPPPPMAGHHPVGDGGLELADFTPTAPAAPTPPAPMPPGTLPIGGNPPPSLNPSQGLPVGISARVVHPPGVVIGGTGVSGTSRVTPSGPVPIRTAMPAGGVIRGGGLPTPNGAGPGSPARLTPGGGGLPGVLGANGNGTTGTGTGMAGGQGRGRRSERPTDSQNGDPDSVWSVAEGVDPVIEADVRPVHHDPGPGVIGWTQ
jgi:hypothetical protein